MKDFLKRLKEDSKFLLILMLVLAFIVLAFFFFWAGLVALFFIGLFVWIIFIFAYLKVLFKISFEFRLVVFILLILFTVVLLYKAVPDRFTKGGGSSKGGEVVNGITLIPCTKTAADQPVEIPGTKAYLYSAPLDPNQSAEPNQANNITNFSLKGINDKTEKNSFFGHFEMADDSSIVGYDEEMEVCNADNKANKYYTTADHDKDDIVDEDDVTGRTHYFHGGKYIAEPGTYRVDYLVRDKADGQWKLVKREENITVTE